MHTCIIMKAWTCTKRCHHLYILQTYRNIIQESEWGAQITRCLMPSWTVTNALTSSSQQKPIICAIINEVQTEIILYFIDIAIYNIKPLSKHLPRQFLETTPDLVQVSFLERAAIHEFTSLILSRNQNRLFGDWRFHKMRENYFSFLFFFLHLHKLILNTDYLHW